ncbi:MAG: DNA methyltransferase, partial [Chloroflexota bacterium]
MPTTITPQEFVAKWRHITLKERSASQSHFNDLCRLVGDTPPVEADPDGGWYAFEKGASKSSGGEGFADVWKRGHFAWEYKGLHADLNAAYQQLLQYREALENPPLLVVSDMHEIVVHTNFTNTVKRVIRFELDDLLDAARLTQLRQVFLDPQAFLVPRTAEDVTRDAAAKFARLAELLRAQGVEPERAAHFLIRLLFCLFSEDVGLLPDGLFGRLARQARLRPDDFQAQLRQLFAAMNTGGWFGEHEIRHFDGGLFDSDLALKLDAESMEVLAAVADLDWGSIEPSILGTLFERGLDPNKRAQLGAHYTSRDDILLIVEPVLMAPLRRRWADVQDQARAIAKKRDEAAPRARAKPQEELRQLLAGFAAEIAAIQVLDPACGSGNFLYVALRQLLDLWKVVSALGSQLGLALMTPLPGLAPHPAQLHGIEINPYAHELAQATIWIGYLQWLDENGFGFPAPPILQPLRNVLEMDAILAYDAQGKPVEPAWPAANVIIGNPPFLGGGRI